MKPVGLIGNAIRFCLPEGVCRFEIRRSIRRGVQWAAIDWLWRQYGNSKRCAVNSGTILGSALPTVRDSDGLTDWRTLADISGVIPAKSGRGAESVLPRGRGLNG